MRYPVITIHQPWAEYIVSGKKTIETRTHKRFKKLVGTTILIHASSKPHPDFPTGDIVGRAYVYDFRLLTEEDSAKAMVKCGGLYPLYGLFLKDVERIGPITAKGKQGIWYFNL